jgi:hypothetical protein
MKAQKQQESIEKLKESFANEVAFKIKDVLVQEGFEVSDRLFTFEGTAQWMFENPESKTYLNVMFQN